MSSRKEYEMLFKLNAQLGSSYNSTFKSGQAQLAAMQNQLQALNKAQGDISSYQKQQAAITASKIKLEALQKEYDNIQKEISETGKFSSDLENKLLKKQQQIEKTTAAIKNQEGRLNELDAALKNAGVDTSKLTSESSRLEHEYASLKQEQEEAAESAGVFGDKSVAAVNAVQEVLVAAGIAKLIKEIGEAYVDAAKASIEFESAMAGVAKTTDFTDKELNAMGKKTKALSTDIPIITDELAGVEEAAGQLGIAKQDILEFSTVMAELGTATDLTSEAAATMNAQIAGITRMDPAFYSNMGSTVVDLGNNFATTESKIVSMAQGYAASANIARMSEPAIFGVSAAVTSLGFEAQMGATAMSKLTSDIQTAVDSGEDLDTWARVAGMDAKDFAAAWKTDAAGALNMFVEGLGRINDEGGSVTVTLSDLGITEARMSNVVKALATSKGRLANALQMANVAWSENTALTEEAEKRYGTSQSALIMLSNAYNNAGIAIGDIYNPEVKEAAVWGKEALIDITEFVEKNPEVVKAIMASVAVLALATGGLTAYTIVAKVATAATTAFTAVTGVALAPVLAVVGGIAALVGVTTLLASSSQKAKDGYYGLTAASKQQYDELQELNDEYETAKELYGENSEEARALNGEIVSLNSEYEEGKQTLREYRKEQEQLAEDMRAAASAYRETVEGITDQRDSSAFLISKLYDLASATSITAGEQEIAAGIVDELNSRYTDLGLTYDKVANSVNLTKEQILDLIKAEAQQDIYEANKSRLVEIQKELWELDKARADAIDNKAAAQKRYDAILAKQQQDEQHGASGVMYSQEIAIAEAELQQYKDTEEEVNATIQLRESEQNSLLDSVDDYIDKIGDAGEATFDIAGAMGKLQQAYADTYAAAKESVEGQISLTEKWTLKSDTSVTDMIANLNSQAKVAESYSENLVAAQAMGLEEGLLKQLSTFSQKSAQTLNEIINNPAKLAELNAAYASAMSNGSAAADASGLVSANMTETVAAMLAEAGLAAEDGAVQIVEAVAKGIGDNEDMLTEGSAQTIVDALVASGVITEDDAADVGSLLVSNIAKGVLDDSNTLFDAVRRLILESVSYAQNGSFLENQPGYTPKKPSVPDVLQIPLPGFASGTHYAPDALIAGENGPELIVGAGGSTIYPSDETRRMLAAAREYREIVAVHPEVFTAMSEKSANLSATAASVGGATYKVDINVQVNGDATADTVRQLRAAAEEIKISVIDALEERAIDAGRGEYR